MSSQSLKLGTPAKTAKPRPLSNRGIVNYTGEYSEMTEKTWVDATPEDFAPTPLPEGSYKFRLEAAGISKRDATALTVRLRVVEGENSGETVFIDYPDFNRFKWSKKAALQLLNATGVEALPGETVIAALGRAATQGVLLSGDVTHRSYEGKADGKMKTAVEVNRYSIGPAV